LKRIVRIVFKSLSNIVSNEIFVINNQRPTKLAMAIVSMGPGTLQKHEFLFSSQNWLFSDLSILTLTLIVSEIFQNSIVVFVFQ
jgi:hypothetical protein